MSTEEARRVAASCPMARHFSRRRLLTAGAASVVLTALGHWGMGCQPYGAAPTAAPTKPAAGQPTAAPGTTPTTRPLSAEPAGARRVVNAAPPVFESPLDQVQGPTTPAPLFFVRDHFSTPTVDAKAWRLKVDGSAVGQPLELSLDDIKAMPSRTQANWIECAGNGRSFFATFGGKPAQGGQWLLGGISVGEWAGVPLADILNKAQVKSSAVDVLLEGLDEGKVGRPIPVKVATDPTTLLAYNMNGQPLPVDQGFPLRAIVPLWVGIANIKWLGRIQVEDKAIKNRYNTELYVMKGPDYPDSPPVTLQNIKTAVALPWEANLTAGNTTVRGFAWSARGKIAKVEYSLDNGKIWSQATITRQDSPLTWAQWQFTWQAAAGSYTIMTKSTDENGNTQPASVPWNEQGYLYNAIVPHPVKVA